MFIIGGRIKNWMGWNLWNRCICLEWLLYGINRKNRRFTRLRIKNLITKSFHLIIRILKINDWKLFTNWILK